MESGAPSEQDLRSQALERLKKKRDLRAHVLIYLLVNAFLVVIWAVSSDGDEFFWPIFVIVGWGIGVVANAWDVYGRKPITEDEIRRETDRLRG
jgi:2TM domain